MQVALEFSERRRVAVCARPVAERLVRRLEKLRGLLGKDCGDLSVVLDFRRRFRWRLLGKRLGRGRRADGLELTFGDRPTRLYTIGQFVKSRDQRSVVGTLGTRLVDLGDDAHDANRRGAQHVERLGIEANFVVMHAAYIAVERPGNAHATLDVCHVRAAVQRVAGAVQLIGHRIGWALIRAGIGVVGNDFEVPCRFLREDIEQHRVHLECRRRAARVLALDREYLSVRVALRKRVGPCDQ